MSLRASRSAVRALPGGSGSQSSILMSWVMMSVTWIGDANREPDMRSGAGVRPQCASFEDVLGSDPNRALGAPVWGQTPFGSRTVDEIGGQTPIAHIGHTPKSMRADRSVENRRAAPTYPVNTPIRAWQSEEYIDEVHADDARSAAARGTGRCIDWPPQDLKAHIGFMMQLQQGAGRSRASWSAPRAGAGRSRRGSCARRRTARRR